jgi:hypothetical protein
VSYEYSFSTWPDEECSRWNRAFNDFREDLAKVGLTLREIERVPYSQPVTVL